MPIQDDDDPSGCSQSLRDIVIKAGLDVLDRDGLGLGTESITYTRVFDYLEDAHSIRVTRASVHKRIWPSHGDFRSDVVAEVVRHFPAQVSKAEGAVLASTTRWILDQRLTGQAQIAEFARIVGHDLFKAMLDMPGALEVQSMKALACRVNDQGVTESIRQRISERSQRLLALRSERFLRVARALGWKVKPELGLDMEEASLLFYTMAINLFAGGALNYHAGCTTIADRAGVDDRQATTDKPWLIASIGLQSLLQFLFDVDDQADPEDRLDLPTASATPWQPPESAAAPDSSRRSREQLRQLVLAAGVEVLLREGLHLRPESLRYGTVFSYLKDTQGRVLHRSSVHSRLWESNEEYWLDVLATAIDPEPEPTPSAESTEQSLSESTVAESLIGLQDVADIFRSFVPAQMTDLLSSPDHLRFQLIKAALANHELSPAVDRLKEKVATSQQRRIDKYSVAIRQYILRRGFEVRPQLGLSEDEALQIFMVLSLASTSGAIFDQMAGIDASSRSFDLCRTDRPDELDQWTPPAVAIRVFFEHLFQETDRQDDARPGQAVQPADRAAPSH